MLIGSSLVVKEWRLITSAGSAGALAAPPGVVTTTVSAAIGVAVCVLGLVARQWSGLPRAPRASARPAPRRLRPGVVACAIGVGFGLASLGVLRIVIEPHVPAIGARIAAAGLLPLWRRAVIIYVAAVGEELLFRMLLVSVVVGITTRVLRRTIDAPPPGVQWWAIGVAALAFAAVHLPAWNAATPLNVAVVVAVILLNALGGAVFGYVFVSRGIALAILAHAGADCAIQFIGPLTR